MKIAIYSGSIPSTTFIERLIQTVVNNGHEVLLFGRIKQRVAYTSPNIHLYTTPHGKWGETALTMLRSMLLLVVYPARFFRYYRWAFHEKKSRHEIVRHIPVVLHLPDVFHVQWAKAAPDWLFLKELFQVKLALSLRGTHITITPRVTEEVRARYLASFCHYDAFHLVNQAMKRHAEPLGCAQERSRVIYSGFDTGQWNEARTYEKRESLSLLVIGRFHYVKGYDYMLDALKQLHSKGFSFTLKLIAGGDSEEFLLTRKQYGLEEHVTLCPEMKHEMLLQEMDTADALLLPSIEEGIANVAIEAMASGLPVISSHAGGMPELIQHGITGMLFARRDADAMAQCIQAFQNLDGARRRQMAKQARESLLGTFDMETFRKNVDTFYNPLR